MDELLFTRDGPVATLTLNRPDRTIDPLAKAS